MAQDQPPTDSNYLDFELIPWWQRPTPRRLLAVLLALTLLAAAAALPARRAYLTSLARQHATQAARLLAEGRFSEAHDHATLGLQRRPHDPTLLRLAAQALAAAENPACLDAWQTVLNHPESTPADRLDYADLALALDQPHRVQPLLENLPDPIPPATLHLAARYRLRVNDLPGALRHARELAQSRPLPTSLLLSLARILAARTEPQATRAAIDLLRTAAATPSPEHLDALHALLLHPAASRDDLQWAAQLLSATPEPSSPDPIRPRLLLAEARIRLDPPRAREIALDLLPGLNPSNPGELLQLVAWLNRHQLFDRSLPLLTPSRIHSDLPLFRSRLEALLGAGQTAPAYRECLRDNPGIDPLELELDRFRLATLLGEFDAARVHQETILRLARANPRSLRRVTTFAETHSLTDLAIAAWKVLSLDRLEARRAIRTLARLSDASGDTWAARDFARRLAPLEPDNAQLQLQIAHYDLLLREGIASALSVAESLIPRPEFSSHARTLAAYACLLLDQRERGRNHLARLEVPVHLLTPPLRALHTAMLSLTGHDAEARTLATSIPLANLRPEERELVRPFLTP